MTSELRRASASARAGASWSALTRAGGAAGGTTTPRSVGFINTEGRLHAALIGTDIVGEKTKEGVGINTPLAKLLARYRVACNNYPHGKLDYRKWYTDPGEIVYTYCLLGEPSTPTTIFGLRCLNYGPTSCTGGWVIERVIVRTSF